MSKSFRTKSNKSLKTPSASAPGVNTQYSGKIKPEPKKLTLSNLNYEMQAQSPIKSNFFV